MPDKIKSTNDESNSREGSSATDPELQALRGKIERLTALATVNSLEAGLLPKKSLWDRPALVAILGALAAAIAPSVTAINGFYRTQQEIRLREVELAHTQKMEKIRLESEISSAQFEDYAIKSFLAQALDPDLTDAHRFRALRYIEMVAASPMLKNWAAAELDIAISDNQSDIDRLEKVVANLEDDLAKAKNKRRPALEVSIQQQLGTAKQSLETARYTVRASAKVKPPDR